MPDLCLLLLSFFLFSDVGKYPTCFFLTIVFYLTPAFRKSDTVMNNDTEILRYRNVRLFILSFIFLANLLIPPFLSFASYMSVFSV